MQEVKDQESRVSDFCIHIPLDLFRERNSCNARTVNISSLPQRYARRSAGIYPAPHPLVKKQPWTYQKQCSRGRSSLEVNHLSSTGPMKELLPLGCNHPGHQVKPRRLKHARWLSWEEGGGASGIRMQTTDSLASLGASVVYDDLDMIEMVAKANNIDVNAERLLPGLQVRQCTLRSRLDDAAGGRPPKDPRTDVFPSSRALFTSDQSTRSDQAEPHRHAACPAQDQRDALLAGSDAADVISRTMSPYRRSRPPSEMLSVDVVMAWLLDGSVPAEESNFLPIIQGGKKEHKNPR